MGAISTNSMSNKDPQNPYTASTSNDEGSHLVQLVIDWYRGHRNTLNSTQQTNVVNAITSILNGTFKV